jgi:uncharacterized phage protein gp47/JayE
MSQTYEEILQGMLDRAPDNVDKREGSIIYDALAPCAFFLAQQQFLIDNYIDLMFVDTAVGEYLDKAATDHGITRKSAAAAIRQVNTTKPVDIGTRWAINELTYIITELVSPNQYKAECTTPGIVGNQYYGALSPLSTVSTVEAVIDKVLLAGTDEETDGALRERIFDKIRKPATSGNVHQYRQWAMECEGVGAAKVFPLANGPGTVKVVITDSNRKAAGPDLVNLVADYLDEVRPIGADVSVVSAQEKGINVYAGIKLKNGLNLGTVQNLFEEALAEHLQDNAFDVSYISLAKVGSLLLNTAGVEDFDGLLINGVAGNQELQDEEIAVLGTVTLEVI